MSIECKVRLVCEGCEKALEHVCSSVEGMRSIYWQTKILAEAKGWVFLQQRGVNRHYCRKCADGPVLASKLSVKTKPTKGKK